MGTISVLFIIGFTSVILLSVTAQTIELVCPAGWSRYGGGCYHVVTEKAPWDVANVTCHRNGGKLVEPAPYDLNQYIGNLATSAGLNNYWIGYNRRGFVASAVTDLDGQWSDLRQEKAYFGHWGADNPNVQAGQCVFVELIDGAYQWQFTPCSNLISYVCQLSPCPLDMFRCVLTGYCLSQSVVCNGVDECGDGSDEANCVGQCNFVIRDQSVDIESNNYPNPYDNGQMCQWTLVGPIGSRIELQFLSFNTEEDADVVEIRVGGQSMSTSSRLTLLSGDSVDISATYISTNNLMIIRFQTDGSISTFGFSAKWSTNFVCGMVKLSGMRPFDYTYSNMQIISLNALQDINFCETLCINQTCSMFSYEASRRRCTLFDQPIKPVPDQTFDMYVNRCPNQRGTQPVDELPNSGGYLIAVSSRRQLSSPLYPLQIPGNLHVTYIIEAESEFVITIELLDADVGPLDYMMVYDGETTSSSLLGRFTYLSDRQTIASTSAKILVHMRTQTGPGGRGFLLSYRQGCKFEMTESSGTIMSPGYGRVPYPSRTTCSWQVTNTVSLPLKIQFLTPFEMETNRDFLQVYVGSTFSTARHPGLGFTGLTTPPSSISTQSGLKGQFMIVMVTSAIGTGVGFNLRYSTDCPQINASSNNIQISPTGQAGFEDVITIQCRSNHVFTDPRYRLQSRVTVACQFGGTWSISPIPECYALFCGKVAAISNGYVLSTTGVYAGNTVQYQCLPGYNMVGVATSTCLGDGSWTSPPRCQAIPCNVLPSITNGRYTVVYGSGTGYGTVVAYSCDPGFEVVGVSRLVCGQSRTWSNLPPVCQRRLCTIRPIQNGLTLNSGSLYTAGDLVRVQCNPGYRINGANPYRCAIDDYPTCQDINECTDLTATCQQSCQNLPGSYRCYCSPGFRTDPDDSNNCLNINECFEGYCGQGCTDSPGGYTCLCNRGYELYRFYAQRGLSLAGEDGTKIWHEYSINHTCIRVPCPSRNLNVQNGRALTSQVSFVYGDKIEYLCNMGFVIQGTATSQCLSSGNWDFPAPICQAITCPPAVLPATNPPNPSTTFAVSYRTTVSYTCVLPGGVPLVKSRMCLYHRDSGLYLLLGDDLNCPEVDCGTPMQISGSLPYTIATTLYPTQFNFACRNPPWVIAGQSSQGDFIIRCGADGKWDYGSLGCDGPTCTDPGRPLDGVQEAKTYEEYSVVSFRCLRPGFMPEPRTPITCQYNPSGGATILRWNGTVPTCVDVTVPEFSNCPTDIIYTRVHHPPGFTQPTVRDNSGTITSFTTSPTNFNPEIAVANNVEVVYIAEDNAGNQATCVVQVKLVDERPPQINGPSSVKVEITSATSVVNVDPTNLGWAVSGETLPHTLQYNPPYLNLTREDIGRIYYIKATAEDSFGNTASSRIQVSVTGTKCQPWSLVIRNGFAQCLRKTGVRGGYVCDVKCNPGYGFYENINVDELRMECTDGQDWDRPQPECVALHYPTYLMDFHLRYSKPTTLASLNCGGVYSQLLTNNLVLLTNSLTRDVCNSVSPSVTVSLATGGLNVSVEPATVGEVVLVKISLEILPKGYDNQPYTTCATYLYRVFSQVDTQYLSSITPLNSFQQGGCPAIQAAFDGLLYNNFECHGHEEFRELQANPRTHCLECPLGYYSEKRQLCIPCKRNTYRDTLGSDYCPACPEGSRSTIEGAKSVDECSRTCPDGMISPTGTAPCTECPYNTYSYNTTYCSSCPPSTFTRGPGKGKLADCIRRCDAGTYSYDGLQPCTFCPKNTYQDKVRQIRCIACPDTQHTAGNGSVTPASCTNAYQRLCLNPNPCGRGQCFVAYFDYYCTNCPPGVTGPSCNMAVNYCDSSPCHNGGSCIVTITGFRCSCPPGTSGNLCESQSDECAGHQCQNGGMCQDTINGYNCLCPSYSPYSGARCLATRNPCVETPCSNGNCVSYGNIRRKCECSTGYTGEDCSININECTSSPCINGGTCIDDINSFRCNCVPGYGGRFCEERDNVCATSICGVNGQCVDNYIDSATRCVCSFNFQDVSGVCNLIDECASTPCLNSGTCSPYTGGFTCGCPLGFEGFLCQHNIDDCAPNPCRHEGICVDKVNGYECLCTKADTGGPNCEDTHNNCDPYPCVMPNGPSCTDLYNDYICNCATGWSGKNCTERTVDACAKSPCQHNSTCVNMAGASYACSCQTGWTGSDCETAIDACNSHLCDNRGICINTVTAYFCQCPSNYRGDLCKTSYNLCGVANHCVGPGSRCSVVNGQANCTCLLGWSGDGCEVKNVICTPTICQNGATCTEIGSSYSCSCVPGYTGSRCEAEVNECSLNTCPAGHICEDQFNSYRCVCPSGKYGQTCNKDIQYGADLVFTPGETFPGNLVDSGEPIPLDSTGLTVSFWVRYTGEGRFDPGTVLTLYGLNTPDVTGPKTELLTVEGDKSLVSFAGGSPVLQNAPNDLADGLWHHVALTWDGSTGVVRLIIDQSVARTLSPYGRGRRLPEYGYLVLGGKYDPATDSLLPDGQFEGRLSHVEVIPRALVFPGEVARAADQVPPSTGDSLVDFTDAVLTNPHATLDYQGELAQNICRAGLPCPSNVDDSSQVRVTSCDENQVIVSPNRVGSLTWTPPVFDNSFNVTSTYSIGDRFLWGTYYVTYVGVDRNGAAATCTVRIAYRRNSCEQTEPTGTVGGRVTCDDIPSGRACSAECTEYKSDQSLPTAQLYSCNAYTMWGAEEKLVPFQVPACAKSDDRLVNALVRVVYSFSRDCNSISTQLRDRLRSVFTQINSDWQSGLCNSPNCDSMPVYTNCTGQYMETTFNAISNPLKSAINNNVLRSPADILTEEFVDNSKLNFEASLGATPDVRTLEVVLVPYCVPGSQLIKDTTCVNCAAGTFYNNDTARCETCEKGSYQDGSAQFSCTMCPSGQTTAQTGAQSSADCHESCTPGDYFDLSEDICNECPFGSYQSLSGYFYCIPCDIGKSTLTRKSVTVEQCVENGVVFESTTLIPVTFETPATGAATTTNGLTDGYIAAIVIGIILLLLLLLLLLLCCCRDRLAACCPCCVTTKVKPEHDEKWRYMSRYGESNDKFVNYRLNEVRDRGKPANGLPATRWTFHEDKASLMRDIASEGSQTPPQVASAAPMVASAAPPVATAAPVLPPLDLTESPRRRKKKTRKHKKHHRSHEETHTSNLAVTETSGKGPVALPPIPSNELGNPMMTTFAYCFERTESGRFQTRPKTEISNVQYSDFVTEKQTSTPRSIPMRNGDKIMVDSDEEDYR